MLKHLFVFGLVIFSGAAFAADCSKMSPAQLRMVEDIKKDCATKPQVKTPKKSQLEIAWESARKNILSRYPKPESMLLRNVKGTFTGGIFCGEIYTNNGYQIFYYVSGVPSPYSVADEPGFSATNFARACLGSFELFKVDTKTTDR